MCMLIWLHSDSKQATKHDTSGASNENTYAMSPALLTCLWSRKLGQAKWNRSIKGQTDLWVQAEHKPALNQHESDLKASHDSKQRVFDLRTPPQKKLQGKLQERGCSEDHQDKPAGQVRKFNGIPIEAIVRAMQINTQFWATISSFYVTYEDGDPTPRVSISQPPKK